MGISKRVGKGNRESQNWGGVCVVCIYQQLGGVLPVKRGVTSAGPTIYICSDRFTGFS